LTFVRIYRFICLVSAILIFANTGFAQTKDSSRRDSLRYPIQDRRGDRFSWRNRNPFNISDTSIIKEQVEYDPVSNRYYIMEKIGNRYYRTPTYLTAEEYLLLQGRMAESDYFRTRSEALFQLNRKVKRPKLNVYDRLFNRVFGITPGGMKVDVKPQGNVDLLLGYQGQKIKNPTLPENARNTGGLDFDMNANLNVIGSIGDKLKLPISYNTLANFDYENQLKLDYKGQADEILKSFELGNMSWQSKSTLIPSTQSLFGVKTQLQFGKLFVTAALANQRAQRQTMNLQGNGVSQSFNKKLDDYEENRHFLLAQYFRNNYNRAMSKLPVVTSQVQILRMEVWVTNRSTGSVTDTRNVVGLMDLGEPQPFRAPPIQSLTGTQLPQNGANSLFSFLTGNAANRDPSQIVSRLQAFGLRPVEDFEKTFARKLNTTEYYFNPQVGFLSLYQQLQPDEVLGVAYQYTYNGRTYQVGEFSQDVGVDSLAGVQKVLFLKLLKATSNRVALPIWDLMMKNVYSLDLSGVQKEDFKLNVLYEEPSAGLKRYLPEVDPAVEGKSLIALLNADRLNNQNDPLPDGLYDYVDGFTVLGQQGKIIFPVLEPFGSDLAAVAFTTLPQSVRDKYLYPQLYDSIKAIAQTFANLNRFQIQGTAKGTNNSEIFLGTNIPQGSVTVTANGQALVEGSDYIIDYNLGTIKIINSTLISTGAAVQVQYENNATFGMQQRSFLGMRLEYLASKKFSIGATMVRLSERPYFTKTNYGEDPIRNTMYGLDMSYQTQSDMMKRLLNKLPFFNGTAPFGINAYGEAAMLKPGHPSQIGSGEEGLSYIDDFEGTRSEIDLRFPFVSWALASTPVSTRFPEASRSNDTTYGINRAKLAWYNIEPVLQDKSNSNNPLRSNLDELSDPRVRQVFTKELFPQRSTNITNVASPTFDLAYYPTERGPYNFETRSSELLPNGKFRNPKAKWGGIMRSIDQTDFETNNIEFIECWVQDPFIKKPNSTGGKLIVNLGNVSEDVLKDGKRFYENGLNTPNITASTDNNTVWGRTPVNPIQVTTAFSNTPEDRPYQDVGFDGLNDDDERVKRSNYLTAMQGLLSGVEYQRVLADPSNDNYVWYRDEAYNTGNTGILGRYKYYNNPQGNSPVATTSTTFSPAATLYPDNEDLNRDNTLNETEEYYEYQIDLAPGMDVGLTKYITDTRLVTPDKLPNGTQTPERWYLFRIPIRDFTSKVGNIPDFKSIRFVRMYMTGFEDSTVLRFAKLSLVRNQWRNFTYEVTDDGTYSTLPANSTTQFDVLAVNLEENSSRSPVNYVIPPGIERVQQLSNNGVNLLLNEQSMSLRVQNLPLGKSRAVFKTMNLDLRQYGQLSMFIHAESILKYTPLRDDQLYAVVRIGQDFLTNYYEIKIPLKVTRFGSTNADSIWPAVNNLDFALQELVNLKIRRNSSGTPVTQVYRETINNKVFGVFGNPNLGEVRAFLIGVQNQFEDAVSAEVWVNELRLSKMDEHGGYAALGRVDMQLSDLGTMTVSANMYTAGFGTLEQRVNERARNNFRQFDVVSNLNLSKLLPQNSGVELPFYFSYNRTVSTPEYDPYDLDIKLKDKINSSTNRDSVRNAAIDQSTTKIFSFQNVKFGTTARKNRIYNLKNFDFSYSFTHIEQSSPLVLLNDVKRYRGGFGYTYSAPQKFIQPFKGIKNRSIWLAFIKDFNFNYNPSLLSFRADINRQYGQYTPRIVNLADRKVDRVDTTYDKYFTFDRFYNLRWDLTRSLNLDYSAVNNARIDEPYGALNTKEKKDTVRDNFYKGGRNTLFTQRVIASYNLPLSKFPFADWITTTYSYTASYNWIGASRLAINLGNIIENGQENALRAQFDFTRLYAKSRFLSQLDNAPIAKPQNNNRLQGGVKDPRTTQPNPLASIPTKEEVVKGLKGKARTEALRKWRAQKRDARKAARLAKFNTPMDIAAPLRWGGKLLTMIKQVGVQYNENYHSRIPGWMDSTRMFGQNISSGQPGLGYILGRQPDTGWLNAKARQGLLSRDTTFNLLYQQKFEQKLSITAQLEPIRDLIISLNLDKSYTKDYSELFKDTTGQSGFSHLSPLAGGGFSVSYISFKTLFNKFNPNAVSTTFQTFQNNRLIISKRLAALNPYYTGGTTNDGFASGYSRTAQDVLIPAFIAAYTGKDPADVSLIKQENKTIKSNPFSGIKPMPNWNLTYNGLTRVPAIAKTFSNVTITHGYNGTLSMNSFTSALLFSDPFRYGAPSFVDTISGNYIPFYLVPNVTISEQFSPLIGVDVTTTNQVNLKFEYRKSRQLSLSLLDYQLSEVRSTEIVFGGSFRKKGFALPFRLPFMKSKRLENDINFRLDMGIRDDAQSNSRIDATDSYVTGGQKVITIQPAIDYVMNNRINVKLYFDQRRVIPYTSTSAPTVNTRAGLQVRISIAP
jgi:cell surface protein SprA